MTETGPEVKSGTSTTPETRAPQPEAPKTDAEKAEAEKKAAEVKKEEGKKDVIEQAKAGLEGLGLGGDFGILMKRLFETFGKFISSFDDIKDKMGNIFASKTPEEVDKTLSESKDYKIPKISDVDKIMATIEDPKEGEKLVSYLYRCLKVPVPTPEQLHPKKELDIRHIMFQMMASFQFAKGSGEITQGIEKDPKKFYKDDIIFFHNKFSGEITAGFIQKVGPYKIEISTIDESNGQKITEEKYKNECLMAFHIPTNKSKGPVPIETKEKKKDEKKEDKKEDKKVDQ